MPEQLDVADAAPVNRSVTVAVERLMTVKEFADIEEMSTKAVYDGVKYRGWPHYRRGANGGVIKFSVAQLLEIREMQRVSADPNRRPPRRRPRRAKAAA